MLPCIKGHFMKFQNKMVEGHIVSRYKRFLSDVILDQNEQLITAHVANTGRMTSCWEPGQRVLLSYHDNPKRKLPYSLELIHNGQSWIVINTHLANKLVVEAIKDGTINELNGYPQLITEYKIGDSRIDILLQSESNRAFVEVKSVTLNENGTAYFPDAVSTRGQKHLQELMKIKQTGDRAVLFLLVQREDVQSFKPAAHIDPIYSKLFRQAVENGVEILVYQSSISSTEIRVSKKLPWELY